MYDPTQNYDPPLRHITLTLPMVGEGEDDDSSHVWTEIEVQDLLDSSLAPIFQIPTTLMIPDLALSKIQIPTTLMIPDLALAEESIEDDILSDIEDHQAYLHSLEDDDISMHEPVSIPARVDRSPSQKADDTQGSIPPSLFQLQDREFRLPSSSTLIPNMAPFVL